MDDYTREMMDLKTLVTRTLEKKGVLARIRAELRASVFEAIEEEDQVIGKEEGLPPALLGSCNDRAKQLHASPSGRLLAALQKDFWKVELKEFSIMNGYDLNRNGDSPLLLDNLSQARASGRRYGTSETDSLNLESRNMRRPSSSSVAGGLPPLGRAVPSSQASDRRGGSSMSGYRKDDYNWRYDNDELPEDVIRASSALENLQLDRKARNLSSSWSVVVAIAVIMMVVAIATCRWIGNDDVISVELKVVFQHLLFDDLSDFPNNYTSSLDLILLLLTSNVV
ncbi:protein TONNEAU 1b-like [Senna tora]|uniref:Protein TONNEAU 1b-like n=1 Tax=Senna tora TaxID=362788 RepID=A0A834WBT4_9FABA|nr:protein TONNEAU 1b-like [Senna tora]